MISDTPTPDAPPEGLDNLAPEARSEAPVRPKPASKARKAPIPRKPSGQARKRVLEARPGSKAAKAAEARQLADDDAVAAYDPDEAPEGEGGAAGNDRGTRGPIDAETETMRRRAATRAARNPAAVPLGQGARYNSPSTSVLEGLGMRQRAFVGHYAATGDPIDAARLAGYSLKSLHSTAKSLMTQPRIKQAIAEARAAMQATTGITTARTIEEIGRVALSDIRRLFDPASGTLLQPWQWDDATAAAVASIEFQVRAPGKTRTLRKHRPAAKHRRGEDDGLGAPLPVIGVTKVRLWPKNDALRLLAQALGMLVDRSEVNVTASITADIERMSEAELRAAVLSEVADMGMVPPEIAEALVTGLQGANDSRAEGERPDPVELARRAAAVEDEPASPGAPRISGKGGTGA